jgi:hypothetical protein
VFIQAPWLYPKLGYEQEFIIPVGPYEGFFYKKKFQFSDPQISSGGISMILPFSEMNIECPAFLCSKMASAMAVFTPKSILSHKLALSGNGIINVPQ